MEPIIVQKYGGSSLATPEKIRQVARRIVATRRKGYQVVVVVSAMGHATDELIRQSKEITTSPRKRELDMLLSAGERVSMALVTMAVQEEGEEAISFTGSQCGILTTDSHANARIIDIRPVRILDELERGRIVIVAGFQGMSYKREVTTLGRGGSDTTAVALAAALNARLCEICSDVEGVYSADPRDIPEARRIDQLSYDEMEEMGASGAGVLNPDAIEFARSRGVKVYLTSTFKEGAGTMLLKPEEFPADSAVRAVAVHERLYLFTLRFEGPKELETLYHLLGEARVPIHEATSLGHSHSPSGLLQMYFVPERVPDWEALTKQLLREFKEAVSFSDETGAVSLTGSRLADDPHLTRRAVAALQTAGIAWESHEMTRNRLTFVLNASRVLAASRALHSEFLST